jgi:Zn-dependent membrane protease YugP
LINEWQATHRANKYLDEKMLDEAERRKSKNTLGTAFNTYLAGATVPAAIVGGVAGAFASNANNKVY